MATQENFKATQEQWGHIQQWGQSSAIEAAILELRSRIEALETVGRIESTNLADILERLEPIETIMKAAIEGRHIPTLEQAQSPIPAPPAPAEATERNVSHEGYVVQQLRWRSLDANLRPTGWPIAVNILDRGGRSQWFTLTPEQP